MAFSKSKAAHRNWEGHSKRSNNPSPCWISSPYGDENLFFANTGTVPPTNWSAAFHVLKGNIFQLTFYVHSCPFIWEKENTFWPVTQTRLPTQHNNSHRSEQRLAPHKIKDLSFWPEKVLGQGGERYFGITGLTKVGKNKRFTEISGNSW